jgi:chromosome segregation ATPase
MKVEELLELVSNPEKYKKALADLDARKKAIDEALAAQVEVNKISELKAKAEKAVADAEKKASKILEDANKAVEAAKAALQAKQDSLDGKETVVTQKNSLAEAMMASAKELMAKAEQVRKENDKRALELAAEYDKVQAQAQELEDRLARLRSVMA